MNLSSQVHYFPIFLCSDLVISGKLDFQIITPTGWLPAQPQSFQQMNMYDVMKYHILITFPFVPMVSLFCQSVGFIYCFNSCFFHLAFSALMRCCVARLTGVCPNAPLCNRSPCPSPYSTRTQISVGHLSQTKVHNYFDVSETTLLVLIDRSFLYIFLPPD